MAEDNFTVHGKIFLPTHLQAEKTAQLIIQIEDVTHADASSVIVAKKRLTGVSISAGAVISFVIDIPPELVHQKHHYSVRVHVDVNRSGKIERGDFISKQAYPVLTHGYGNQVQVEVHPV